MTKPLEGVRIADFSHVMAGPFATHFLRGMGAEVIKVEAPGRGDPMRNYGPDRAYDGMSPGFIAANCGKKSVVLDLKSEGGLEAARRLIGASDVVLENFRPGVMARLGLGYEDTRKLKSDIIFCSVSGYGQSGALRDYPAIDNIVQATSGLTSLNGEKDAPFMRVGFPAVDTYTGTLAAMAILGALLRRNQTGEGQEIDVAMFDASLVFMASAVVPYLVTGKTMPRTGNTGYSGQPTAAMFETSDRRQISLGVVQQEQFVRLCNAMGCEGMLEDERFATPAARLEHASELRADLSAVFATKTGEEWEALLSAAGAPCGLVRDVPQACSLPHLEERGVFSAFPELEMPEGGQARAVTGAYRCDADGLAYEAPPPVLGQHTEEVLASLGYSDDEVRELVSSGAAVVAKEG